ncbi:putative bifunctional diguanylate cyclase/phosphodiesterase [Pseudorhodoferax soli]|uniref:Diguanylate cyclase/phosphodiesterase n=1 Tax=Pseudorhodoferax soli TaxID=545864 RepID=A0A368XRX7_9BURK|nr:EAL domain-containing protein [Pseudorhodoferax soli]RCW69297.1 diguanylate cyclase/phosphodiesterase [Pseudorhodoferax soli]
MTPALAEVSYNHWVVALSFLIASYASFVALDLAQRVRAQDRVIARAWRIGGSLALGTGIWSMHFVGMLAATLPFTVGYGHAVTGLSWVAAVAASGVALHTASLPSLNLARLGRGALAMGAGICAMHYLGMASLALAPGIQWDWLLVAASAAIAVLASAVALVIFFALRGYRGVAARNRQVLAALAMGAAICGMHYTGMAAAAFPADSVCLSADQLRGDSVGVLVTVAATMLLSLAMFTSLLDARMQGRTERLAVSLKAANAELQEIAFRDALTGLPNRLLLGERVASAVERCRRDHTSLALLFIDLDGFKPVNDSFGHHVGDAVLKEAGRRLAAGLRACDTVARVGGDEFVLLLEGVSDSAAIAQAAQRLIDVVSAPMEQCGHEVRLSCSIGIALFPSDGPDAELMAHADAAMYAAKRAGGSAYAFFEAHMNAGVREQIELQRDLRLALERGELLLHYQPKVSAGREVVTGVEALVRWQHPTRGMLGPALFIPVAERFGLISAVGNWVIEEACRQIAAWQEQGLRLRVAVNLSVHQLRQDDFVRRVAATIARAGIDPRQLTFEITESVAMEDAESTLQAFEALCGIGVHLSIDDFGTGYSSLAYLRQLQVGELKIDRSFVQDLESSADARAIVEAVIRLAHALGLKVVAEGVETAAQQDVLTRLQCDDLQGYLFARPMAAERVAEWAVASRRPNQLPFALSTYRPAGLDINPPERAPATPA